METYWQQGLVYQRRWVGCIFIRPGAFQTMEHLLATRVSLLALPGECIFILPGAFRTMEHVLVTRVSLPASPLSIGQATIIFFIGF
jgi:hypothetical protein